MEKRTQAEIERAGGVGESNHGGEPYIVKARTENVLDNDRVPTSHRATNRVSYLESIEDE